MAAQTCAFFDKLPAEIRNDVYELAFTSDHDGEVRLRNAAPPSKALVLASRQLYNEANQLYKRAYRDYWTKSTFKTSQRRHRYQDTRSLPEHLSPRSKPIDINHITKMKVQFRSASAGGRTAVYEVADTRGIWIEKENPKKNYPRFLSKNAASGQLKYRIIWPKECKQGFEALLAEQEAFPSMMEQFKMLLVDN